MTFSVDEVNLESLSGLFPERTRVEEEGRRLIILKRSVL